MLAVTLQRKGWISLFIPQGVQVQNLLDFVPSSFLLYSYSCFDHVGCLESHNVNHG